MVETAAPQATHVHRGIGTQLRLRVASRVAGTIILRHDETGEQLELATLPEPGAREVRTCLTRLCGTTTPAGTWSMELDADDGPTTLVCADGVRAPVEVRVQDADASLRIRITALAGEPLRVRADEVAPWAELLEVDLDQDHLHVRCEVPDERVRVTGAVWSERDGEGRALVPTQHTGTEVAFETPLAELSRPGRWDVRLVAAPHEPHVALHRDDLTRPQREVVLASVTLDTAHGAVVAEPYVNASSNLSVHVHAPARPGATAAKPADAPIVAAGDRGAPPPRWVHRTVSWVAARLLPLLAPAPRDRPSVLPGGELRPIHLVIANLHGIGGTIRTVVNTANGLAGLTDVQVVSVYRLSERRFLPLDRRVRERTLVDYPWLQAHPGGRLRQAVVRFLLRAPSALVHADERRSHRFSLFSDLQLLRWLRSVDRGTIVTTRTALNVIAARYARPGVAVVGQQHLTFEAQTDRLVDTSLRSYRRLHALTVLTQQDVDELRARLGSPTPRVVRLTNPLAGGAPPTSDLATKRIIAAGRYSKGKGIDLLLAAMAQVVAAHPDWELRLFGNAKPHQLALARRLVREHGLTHNVRLMAATDRLELEMAKSSICVVSSRHEAFGMVIIEAMSCGLPVVSFDCPRGPREIITDGVDGLLVAPEDASALAASIVRLIEDEDLRARIAQAALTTAERYAPERIARGLLDVVDDLPRDAAR